LPDELGENPNAKLLHWTLGAPCFNEFRDTEQAEVWLHENKLMQYCDQESKQ